MTDTDVPYYPDWLARGLIDGALPWDQAQATSMPQFLAEYTLHDSYWIGLWTVPHEEAIVAIRWDSFWSRERIPHPGSKVALWPILLVRFTRLYRATTAYTWTPLEFGDAGITGAETRLVQDASDPSAQGLGLGLATAPRAENQPLVEWPLHATRILGPGMVELLHDTKIDLLCLDRTGTVLTIPDL